MPSINLFLDELYQLDPSLRAHEAQLRPLLTKLITHQPHIQPNETFLQTLRTKLMAQTPSPARSNMSRFWPALAVPALAALALLVYPYFQSKSPVTTDAGVVIQAGRGEAFGALTSSNTASRSAVGTSQDTTKEVALTTAPTDASYRYPVYAYDGPIQIPSGDVLRRTKGLGGLPSLEGATLSLLNPASFSGLKTDNVTWSQRTADGYTIYVDALEGSISISRSTTSGPRTLMLETSAGDSSSTSSSSGSVAERPTNTVSTLSDDRAVEIAKAFLSRHGISSSGLGQPIVQESAGAIYADKAATAESRLIAPDTVTYMKTVIFPWIIRGTTVYDESGNEFGLTVVVNGTSQDVESLYNLMTRSFTSSKYQVTTAASSIRDYLARGGWLWGSLSAEQQTTKIQTEAPTAVYMLSRYQLDNGQSDLLVPALRFPIKAADQSTTGRRAVVVPVIDDLLIAPPASGREETLETKPAPATDLPAPN